jgi:hypothetical protein
MANDTLKSPEAEPVKQFSVFTENKVGRLLDVVNVLSDRNVHTLALTVLDTTDSSILRLIVDDPEQTRQVFREHGIMHVETEILVVEMNASTDLLTVLKALLQAEINIQYTYPFVFRPHDKSALAMYLEDAEIGTQVLAQNGFKVLTQRDISR